MASRREHAQVAAEAHTTLCLLEAIATIAESSDIRGVSAQQAGTRIARICRTEQQRQVVIYDRAMKKAMGEGRSDG